MHDQKYLHLPVVCEGATKGLVDAMDVMNASQGDGNGSEGWRSFWEQTMDVGDDESDTASMRSVGTTGSARTGKSRASKTNAVGSKKVAVPGSRTVGKLRPKKPVVLAESS